MYEVRSKVHGCLTFYRVGKAFGSYGQVGEMKKQDLQDPEVKRALRDGRLEIVAERALRVPPEGVRSTVLFSKKDWENFRKILVECVDRISSNSLECTDRLSSDLAEVIREEGEKIRDSLGLPPNYEVPSGGDRPKRLRARKEKPVDYVITPDLSSSEVKVKPLQFSENGEDIREGLAALKSLREDDGDGR